MQRSGVTRRHRGVRSGRCSCAERLYRLSLRETERMDLFPRVSSRDSDSWIYGSSPTGTPGDVLEHALRGVQELMSLLCGRHVSKAPVSCWTRREQLFQRVARRWAESGNSRKIVARIGADWAFSLKVFRSEI